MSSEDTWDKKIYMQIGNERVAAGFFTRLEMKYDQKTGEKFPVVWPQTLWPTLSWPIGLAHS